MPEKSLSVIIIAKDEAANIRDCLESVKWADEIIVLDSGSSDETVNIARSYTKRVYTTDWPGFGPQKNRALDLAKGQWVFSIDADERITDGLREEIQLTISNGRFDAYSVPRLSSYCGKFLKHGGWWPDRVVRLFEKGKGRFSESLVHEKVIVDGTVGKLEHHLLHFTYRTVEDVINAMDYYSTLGALQKFRKGHRASIASAISHGLWMFFRTYFLKRGFLDGAEGFMLSVSNAEASYYKYVKLRQLSREPKQSEIDAVGSENS